MNDNISMQRQKYGGYIQLIPGEIYLQISNVSQSIFFNSNLSAFLVNPCGSELSEFTIGLNFQFREYFNIYSKKNNVIFEFFINEDYGRELLLLKFVNNTTNETWYSAAFQCTENLKSETTYFEYTNEIYLQGVDYNAQSLFQSIRLACFKNDISEDVQNEEYTQLSGNRIYSRDVITNIDNYKFYAADWFTFKRLSFLLNHSIIYINNFRAFSSPGKISKGERVEDSNLINLDFETNPTEEYKIYAVQLDTELQVVSLEISDDSVVPFGTLINNTFKVTFNKNIQILDNSLKFSLYKENVLVESKAPVVNLNTLSATFDYDFADGNYFILVDPGKVGSNSFGGNQIWNGFNEPTNWNFQLLSAESTSTNLDIAIKWADGTITPKTGNENSKLTYLDYLNTNNPADIVLSKIWQLKTSGGFSDVGTDVYGNNLYNLVNGSNEMRLKATVQSGAVFFSNILLYTKQVIPNYPTTDYWYKAVHPEGHSGNDTITYLDGSGQEQTKTFIRSYTDSDYVFHPAPCTKIVASSIISRLGVVACVVENPCKSYQVTAQVGSGNSIIGTYRDCDGVEQNFAVYGNAGNNTLLFCALQDSIETNSLDGDIMLRGDCQ